MAKAAQVSKKTKDGSMSAVGVGDLRVMIVKDADDEWYAQGLEINYIAQGTNLKSAQAAFERGLKQTINEHLKLYGDIKKLLQPAPPDVWDEFFEHAASTEFRFSHISTHELDVSIEDTVFVAQTRPAVRTSMELPTRRVPRALPFKRIAYLASQSATA
jgi:hypothetical protein